MQIKRPRLGSNEVTPKPDPALKKKRGRPKSTTIKTTMTKSPKATKLQLKNAAETGDSKPEVIGLLMGV